MKSVELATVYQTIYEVSYRIPAQSTLDFQSKKIELKG